METNSNSMLEYIKMHKYINDFVCIFHRVFNMYLTAVNTMQK